MYPQFVEELQIESGLYVDLRDQGAIVFPPPEHGHERPDSGWQTTAGSAGQFDPARRTRIAPRFS